MFYSTYVKQNVQYLLTNGTDTQNKIYIKKQNTYHPTIWQQIIRPLPLSKSLTVMPTDYRFSGVIPYRRAINTAHKCMKHFLIQKYYSIMQ